MKNLTLILLFSVLCKIPAFGQEYEPFISESKEWRHWQLLCTTGGGCMNRVVLNYFKGDTVFNGVNYSKFYEKEIQPGIEPEVLKYFLQEDPANEKVYVHDFQFDRTALLYDFTLQKGDSFNIYILDDIYMTSKVLNVDTITLLNKKLKRITFEDDVRLIEGIGFVTSMMIPYYGELICIKDGNTLLYLNADYTNCDTVFSQDPYDGMRQIKQNPDRSAISIYPLPVTGSSVLEFQGKNNDNLKIEIYNSIGVWIMKDSFNGNYAIGAVGLRTGFYIYRIGFADSILRTGKFFVK